MYWYLSFLRPPPVSASIGLGSITITPQVANDLRTELRYEPTEVYYTWQKVYPDTGPQKDAERLTTFIPPESTYRPLTIPLPNTAVVGERWRLGLFSNFSNSGSATQPSDGGEGAGAGGPVEGILGVTEGKPSVIGVWSEGISIVKGESSGSTSTGPIGAVRGVGSSSKGKSKRDDVQSNTTSQGRPSGKAKGKNKAKDDEGPKQGRIQREWTLPEHSDDADPERLSGTLRIVEQTSFDLDKKIWDSGLALSSWLFRYQPGTQTPSHQLSREVLDVLKRMTGLKVVEIGSGTGLVSIALGLALSRRPAGDHPETEIVATDLDSAIALMEENLTLNGLNPTASSRPQEADSTEVGSRVRAEVLNWEAPLPNWVSADRWPDLIVAADVTYNTASFPHLLSTLVSLLKPLETVQLRGQGDGGWPRLLMAYKQRDEAERELWAMLKAEGLAMTLVDVIQGSEEDGAVEIWVGGAESPVSS